MSSNSARILFLISLILIVSLPSSCATRKQTGSVERNGELLLVETMDVNTGERISLRKLLEEGRPVFMNFWGVKCISCLEELEELNRLYEQRLKKSRIVFLAVNTDGLRADALKKSMEEHDIDIAFAVVADPEMEITDYYTKGFIPHNVIITQEGGREIEIIGYNEKLFYRLQDKLIELAEDYERIDRY